MSDEQKAPLPADLAGLAERLTCLYKQVGWVSLKEAADALTSQVERIRELEHQRDEAIALLTEARGYVHALSGRGGAVHCRELLRRIDAALAAIAAFDAALNEPPAAQDAKPAGWLVDEGFMLSDPRDKYAVPLYTHPPAQPAEPPSAHPDDLAVDRFAAAMKEKLAKKRGEGRSGWRDRCSNAFLSRMLREHVEKGDPLDVGNFAMMLHQRGERIAKEGVKP